MIASYYQPFDFHSLRFTKSRAEHARWIYGGPSRQMQFKSYVNVVPPTKKRWTLAEKRFYDLLLAVCLHSLRFTKPRTNKRFGVITAGRFINAV